MARSSLRLVLWFVFVHALALALSTRAVADAPDMQLEGALQVYRASGAEEALPLFQKIVAEAPRGSRSRFTPEQRTALHYVGECHWRLGEFVEARRHLGRALELARTAGDSAGEARTLNVLGLVAWEEGEYAEATADFRRAGELARILGDRKLEGSSLNNLSLVLDEQGDYDTSLRQYKRVLELYRDADFPRGVGDTLGNIGGVHLLLGHFREARGYYQQALAISERLNSKTSMSQDHGNLGLCLLGMGEVDSAMRHFEQAIDITRQAGMRQDQAYWLRARGEAQATRGRYDFALQDYRAALAMYERIGAKADVLESLQRLGKLHLTLGDASTATRQFERALQIARSIGLERGITANMLALGDIELRRERLDAAAAYYEQGRERAEAAQVQPLAVRSLLRLAQVHRLERRLERAATETERALAIARITNSPGLVAEATYARAEWARLSEHTGPAIADYRAALALASRIGDPDLLWQIHLGLARSLERSDDVAGALASLEAAVELIEGVRGRLQETRFRSGYIEDKFEVYHELMRLQLRQGRQASAFTTAERLRARSFLEQVEGRASLPLSAAERQLEAELSQRVRQLEGLVSGADDASESAYPERAVHRFSTELAEAESAYQAFLDDRTTGHAVAAVPSVPELQRRLGPTQAMIEYVAGTDTLTMFLVSSRGLSVQTVPIGQKRLLARIALLRDLLLRPGDDRWLKPAARLYAQLLEPLERAGSLEGVTHLYVVPHGALTHLPFALLPVPGGTRDELLLDRYTLALLPSAAALSRAAPGNDPDTLLAMAPARGGLRHAAEEARAIAALFSPRSTAYVGTRATEARFKQLAGNFSVLHLATHGRFNEANPLLSGLEFETDQTEDGMLRVHEILDLRLRASLVTLSACDTALVSGYFSSLPAGDEFVGLSRAFLTAGSASVLATLWHVEDKASVSLMRNFYGALRNDASHASPASALAQAQRAIRQDPTLNHPYYWAAYVMVGQIEQEPRITAGLPRRKS